MKLNSFGWIFLFVLGCALPACNCGDDEKACDPAQPTSCGPGQLCKAEGGGSVCVPGCVLGNPDSCASGQACEEVEAGEPRCFGQVELRGKVIGAVSGAGIAGARIAARNSTGVVVSQIATSADDGSYSLPVPAKRKADGAPLATSYQLRADAAAHLSFPDAFRPALPIDVAPATVVAGRYVLESPLTTLALIPLPAAEAANAGRIEGRVDGEGRSGTLVVASAASAAAGAGHSAIADRDGAFVIFNVPAGATTVRGYAAGIQYGTADVTVTAGQASTGVVLSPIAGKALATVSGSISKVNAPTGAATFSVALAAKETFIETLEIGEIPRGLRVEGVTGAFSIPNVPDGDYVALASLENDGLVRDVNAKNGNTELVLVTVREGVATYKTAGTATVTNDVSFKVTDAVGIVKPGKDALEKVTGTPTFEWIDDSGEESYTLQVFDALGNEVWKKTGILDPGGSANVVQAYEGTQALAPGMIYQFRVSSIAGNNQPPPAELILSRTEQLRGIFSVE